MIVQLGGMVDGFPGRLDRGQLEQRHFQVSCTALNPTWRKWPRQAN